MQIMKKIHTLLTRRSVLIIFALFLTLVTILMPEPAFAAKCGEVETSFDFNCKDVDPDATDIHNPIFHLILVGINLMSVALGLAVAFFIIWGAMLYTSSNGEAAKAQKGISYITNAVLALVLFAAMYSVANFLIPGGIFN